jgi:vancomycin resistance protein YoaR
MRPLLSGEEVAADGDGPGNANQQQGLVSSQGQLGAEEGDASEAASAEVASGATKESRQTTEPPATSGKEKLAEFRTDYRYSDSKDRKYNLRLSSQAVDGTVLAPGEVFSMNDNIAGLDYKEAKVFADGGETSALGGGLCQVTSTVYMAAQYAGLEIVERNPHYTTLPYIRPGFDATVWFGGQGIPELDMKFKNTTGSEILIREYVTDDGLLTAEIWGQPTGTEVEMRSEKVFEDLQLGIKWATYKKVTQDGEVIYDGLISTDLYSFPPPESVGDEGYNEVRVGGW